MKIDWKFWDRDYRLDKMSLGELTIAYFLYPAIQTYLVLGITSMVLAFYWGIGAVPLIVSVAAAIVLYPVFWYGLHRFVLHGKYLYRSPLTAKIWKRIHFDHHRDPHDLKVLFGALYTTLPTILILVTPVGWLIGGQSAAAAAFSAGLFMTCFYEYCHCIQHLRYTPKSTSLKAIKKLHLQHHFHDEHHNFGITNFLPDKIFGTFNRDAKSCDKSETVFNLGYTKDEVKSYPWVARMTHDIDESEAAEHGVKQRKYNDPAYSASNLIDGCDEKRKKEQGEQDKKKSVKDAA